MDKLPEKRNEIESPTQKNLNPMKTKWTGVYNFFNTSDLYISECVSYGAGGRILSRSQERRIHMCPPHEVDFNVHTNEDDCAAFCFHLAILENFYSPSLFLHYEQFRGEKSLTQKQILSKYIKTIEFNIEGRSLEGWKSNHDKKYWLSLYIIACDRTMKPTEKMFKLFTEDSFRLP